MFIYIYIYTYICRTQFSNQHSLCSVEVGESFPQRRRKVFARPSHILGPTPHSGGAKCRQRCWCGSLANYSSDLIELNA